MEKLILLFAIISFSAVAGVSENATKPVTLVALQKDSAQYLNICKAAEGDCDNETDIWTVKNKNDIFYLTLPQLQLMKIKKKVKCIQKLLCGISLKAMKLRAVLMMS